MSEINTKAHIINKKLSRLAFVFAGLLVVGFIVANTLAYQHAHAMMYFSDESVPQLHIEHLSFSQKLKTLLTGVKLTRPNTNKKPSALSKNCETTHIPSDQNITLGAWYCPVSNDKPLVILFHGYLKDKSSLIDEAKVFMQEEHSVLLVDFRGSGESTASYTTIGFHEADDVTAAFQYARQHYAYDKIILYGQSMGAAAILRAVHSHQVNADGLIIEAVFDRLLNTVKNRFHLLGVPASPGAQLLVFWGGWQTGFDGFDHNPVDYARAVQSPTLFFHGENDDRVWLPQARSVYKSVPATKYFSTFPETVHEPHLARHPDKWTREIKFFLQSEF